MSNNIILHIGGSSIKKDGLGPAAVAMFTWNKWLGVDQGLEMFGHGKYGHPDLSYMNGNKLNMLFLTHAHTDHLGSLIKAEEGGLFKDEARIYCSPVTAALLPGRLEETWKRDSSNSSLDSLVKIQKRVRIVQPGPQEIEGIPVFVGEAGHMYQAIYLIIRTEDGKNVLFMGDMSWHDQAIVYGSRFPDDVPDEWLPDGVAVTDLTNPSTTSFDYSLENKRFADCVADNITNNRTVIIPAFAINRGDCVIVSLLESGLKPIYADGSIVEISDIMASTPWEGRMRSYSREGMVSIPSVGRYPEQLAYREQLLAMGQPFVVVSPAGMGDRGPIKWWLERCLGIENVTVIGVGYATPESAVGQLYRLKEKKKFKETGKGRIVFEDDDGKRQAVEVRARIESFHLSGHCGLGDEISAFNKVVERRRVMLEKQGISGDELQEKKKHEFICLNHGNATSKSKAAKAFSSLSRQIIYGNPGSKTTF